ncbi:precorrin-2 dehydrogenase / sirohydrochlorin ferrochelatase [Pseudobutyrivibrio sp. YE44]|uniref:precorrin-2 dehydrogenase/sirohydrochlorin ferrochelatase family protein n=1 Tax=Pseudobutyrivibrio sp. YE44 TaxID=1520802 RepID=UPI00088318E6|nr:bifunctional precorrin-2 dehydrogenase/sirohydrochlorin ferrochelatase [Pseudobutyrivibrio sp. YE44]SDB14246.1 precorrin-2 dehydrogenase / sirohydrochlorin ferrochelatase [Pseudobutyrivibrio sp. YE44]
MAYFPMMINIESKPVLVIGGNAEGLKKIKVLKDFGAEVTLIALEAFLEAKELADKYYEKCFEDIDINESDFALIVSAVNDRELDKRIYELAQEKSIPINVVDDVELCTFIFPAIVQEEDVVVAVSSGGKSPFVAKHIKKLIQDILPKNIGEINNHMGEYRQKVKQQSSNQKQRREALKQEFDRCIIGNIKRDDSIVL